MITRTKLTFGIRRGIQYAIVAAGLAFIPVGHAQALICNPTNIVTCILPSPVPLGPTYDFSVFPLWIRTWVESLPLPAAVRYQLASQMWIWALSLTGR